MESNNILKKIESFAEQDVNFVYKHIAQYFLVHPKEVIENKIVDLAKKINCSTGTLSKFAKLVSQNFKILQYELKMASELLNDNWASNEIKVNANILSRSIIDGYYNLIQESLEFTHQNNKDKIYKIVQYFDKNIPIYIFGIGYSQIACLILSDYLMRLGYQVYFSESLESLEYFANNIKENDLVIIFSYSLLTPALLDLYSKFQNVNCKKIVITSNVNSFIYHAANETILVKSNEEVLDKLRNSRMQFNYVSMLIIILLANKQNN